MNYETLGKSDLRVSSLMTGCWAFGGGSYWGAQHQSDVNDVVARSLELGINFFDTAELYNDGDSERALGIALKGKRDKAIIGSKFGPTFGYYQDVITHCESSLSRLQTDYLDLYILHWPINYRSLLHFGATEEILAHPPCIEETMDALMQLKKQGKIRAIGISNFGVTQMREALATGAQIDVNEVTYNIMSRAIEADIVPFCKEQGISVIGSMGLAQGLLAGRYQTADEVPMNQAHSRHYANARGKGTSRHGGVGVEKEMFAALEELKMLSISLGISLSQLSLAWALHKPGITAMLVGSRSVAQLEENAKAASIILSQDVVAEVDRISKPVLDLLGNDPDYYESHENSRIY